MAAKKSKTPEKKIFTDSTFLVKRIYQSSKKRSTEDAGTYPFTRGIHPGMFRERFWTMRQYSGFGDAKLTNERFKFMLEKGQTGLSMAFDLPTQIGYDSDSPQAEGEVGKVGVSITSIKDMMVAFDGILLGKVLISKDDILKSPMITKLMLGVLLTHIVAFRFLRQGPDQI